MVWTSDREDRRIVNQLVFEDWLIWGRDGVDGGIRVRLSPVGLALTGTVDEGVVAVIVLPVSVLDLLGAFGSSMPKLNDLPADK